MRRRLLLAVLALLVTAAPAGAQEPSIAPAAIANGTQRALTELAR